MPTFLIPPSFAAELVFELCFIVAALSILFGVIVPYSSYGIEGLFIA
jgi:hypothetical protein